MPFKSHIEAFREFSKVNIIIHLNTIILWTVSMKKSNEEVEQQQPLGCLHRFLKNNQKLWIIGGLIILLMIPMFMIEDLISERGRPQEKQLTR